MNKDACRAVREAEQSLDVCGRFRRKEWRAKDRGMGGDAQVRHHHGPRQMHPLGARRRDRLRLGLM
jgi:hypothetical protein